MILLQVTWWELDVMDYSSQCIAFLAATDKYLVTKPTETLTLSSSLYGAWFIYELLSLPGSGDMDHLHAVQKRFYWYINQAINCCQRLFLPVAATRHNNI